MYQVEATFRFRWIGDGPGGSYMLGQNQAENAGYGSSLGAGEVPAAQYAEARVTELVPGGDSPTGANFNTTFTNLAADMNTLMTAATNPYNGSTTQTLLAQVQGWSTGGV